MELEFQTTYLKKVPTLLPPGVLNEEISWHNFSLLQTCQDAAEYFWHSRYLPHPAAIPYLATAKVVSPIHTENAITRLIRLPKMRTQKYIPELSHTSLTVLIVTTAHKTPENNLKPKNHEPRYVT